MPWRRTSRLLADHKPTEEMTESERLAFMGVVLEQVELVVERLWGLLRLVAAAVLLVTVAWVAAEVQLQSRNRTLGDLRVSQRETKAAAEKARTAAARASSDLAAAIAAGRSGQLDPRIAKALAQIDCMARGATGCDKAG